MNYFLSVLFTLMFIDKTTTYVNGYSSIDHNEGYEHSSTINEDAYDNIFKKYKPLNQNDRISKKMNLITWRSESRPSDRKSHVHSIANIDMRNSSEIERSLRTRKVFGNRERLSEGLKRTLGSKSEASMGRFFSIFELVNFENDVCVSSSGVRGICVHAFECISAMGQEVGDCANGYGVCCKCKCILYFSKKSGDLSENINFYNISHFKYYTRINIMSTRIFYNGNGLMSFLIFY